MRVSLVAAVAEGGVIGRGNTLPWRLRDDMKAFKARTMGHHIIVGRKTFESFGSKPLPGRTNVVVSRDATYRPTGCTAVTSFEQALDVAGRDGETEAMVIGGAQIYALALPRAETFYLTRVRAHVYGDIYFPIFDEKLWDVKVESAHERDENNEYPFVIETLTRREGLG